MAKNQHPAEFYERLRLEYVNSTLSGRELAEKHGLQVRNLEKKITRGGWLEQRRKVMYAVQEKAQQKVTDERADELSQWNQDDLRLARALRAQVARTMTLLGQPAGEGMPPRLIPPETLRTLAVTAESAQRIGRLALGASTGNQAVQADSLTHAFARAMAEMDESEERGVFDGSAEIPRPDSRPN